MKLLLLMLCSGLCFIAKTQNNPVRADSPLVTTDTLNFLVSAANYIYYYDSPLADDASNLKTTFGRHVRGVILLFRDKARTMGDSLVVVIKIQDDSRLDESSKKAIWQIRLYPHFREGKLSDWENTLIKLTERQTGENR